MKNFLFLCLLSSNILLGQNKNEIDNNILHAHKNWNSYDIHEGFLKTFWGQKPYSYTIQKSENNIVYITEHPNKNKRIDFYFLTETLVFIQYFHRNKNICTIYPTLNITNGKCNTKKLIQRGKWIYQENVHIIKAQNPITEF